MGFVYTIGYTSMSIQVSKTVIFSEVFYLNTRTFLYVPPRTRAHTTVTTPMSIWEPQKAGMPCLNIVGELKAKSAKQERSGLGIYSQFFAKVLCLDTDGVTCNFVLTLYTLHNLTVYLTAWFVSESRPGVDYKNLHQNPGLSSLHWYSLPLYS